MLLRGSGGGELVNAGGNGMFYSLTWMVKRCVIKVIAVGFGRSNPEVNLPKDSRTITDALILLLLIKSGEKEYVSLVLLPFHVFSLLLPFHFPPPLLHHRLLRNIMQNRVCQ